MISVQCPSCQKRLKTTDDAIGKRVRCPGCGQSMVVPAPMPQGGLPVASLAGSPAAIPSPARPVEEGSMAPWWLLRLGLSLIVALIFGAIGYVVGGGGIKRESGSFTFTSATGQSTTTSSAKLTFFDIELLKTEDLANFLEESNRIALRIMLIVVSVCALCGFLLGMLVFRFLTRKRVLAWQT